MSRGAECVNKHSSDRVALYPTRPAHHFSSFFKDLATLKKSNIETCECRTLSLC